MDPRNESVLVPIYGQIIPFHVSMIKNVSKSEEGKYFFLRINFLNPGVTASTKDSAYVFPEIKAQDAFYYRELTIRST